MSPVNRIDSVRASAHPHHDLNNEPDLNDFEGELRRLSAEHQALLQELGDANTAGEESADLQQLRRENAELRARVEELEANAGGSSEAAWTERQREYEILLEEKSDIIRSLHQKLQEAQESVIGHDAPPTGGVGNSGVRLGQAEEIMRLKREIEEHRRQLEQDEAGMMGQMKEMELAMAKERAELARQRQEVQRLQADLGREIESNSRNPELRERLNTLRRALDPKAPEAQQSTGFLSRMFR